MVYFMENHHVSMGGSWGYFPKAAPPLAIGREETQPPYSTCGSKVGKVMGNPPDITGKPWDSYRKTMGNPQLWEV
jgi:hypothetical protein